MISDTARMIEDSADRLIAQHAPQPATETGWNQALPAFKSAVEDAGLLLALVPEAQGGLALSWSEAAILPRLWGRRAAPLPIVEMLLASRIAHISGIGDEWSAASIALAGSEVDAAWWPGARHLLLLSEDGSIGAYDAPDGARGSDLAGQSRLRFHPASASAKGAVPAAEAQRIVAAARLFTAAALVGAMEQAQALALDHARVRTQFGQPLAQFKPIQRLLALSAAEAAASRALLDTALRDLDRDQHRPLQAHAAKARAGQTATLVAANVHQILGAIGFTEEHELHRYTKRLWAWRDDWGTQSDEETAVGQLAAGAGSDGLWSLLADEPDAARRMA